MLSHKREVFAPTDGILTLCEEGEGRRARGIDWSTAEGLRALCTVPYRTTQVRQVDADQMGEAIQTVTMKVCARVPPGLDVGSTWALVGGVAHDVTRADPSGRLCYLYLTRLVVAGTCVLVGSTAKYDELGLPTTTTAETGVCYRQVKWGTDAAGISVGQVATGTLTVRACDWQGERRVRLNGTTYAVTGAIGSGRWVALGIREEAVTRGQG